MKHNYHFSHLMAPLSFFFYCFAGSVLHKELHPWHKFYLIPKEDFSTLLAHTATGYPVGFQGWKMLQFHQGSSFPEVQHILLTTGVLLADHQPLAASSNANSTSTYNYNGARLVF
jgi:hypothetical protein